MSCGKLTYLFILAMYVLSIPSKNVISSLEIKYMVEDKTKNIFNKKPGKTKNVVVGPMTKLISIMDDKKNIVTEQFQLFLFDISAYERYTKILTSFCAWIKKNRTAKIENFDEFTDKKDVNFIKKTLYPSIKRFLLNKESAFIRHGIEICNSENYYKKSVFPKKSASCWSDGGLLYNTKTKKSYWKKKYDEEPHIHSCYPIELDMFPFCENMECYKNRKWPSDKQYGHCSNHDALYSWNKLKGYIPFQDFDEKGGKVVQSMKRDHLYAVSNINVYDWLFVFQNIDGNNEKSKYWGWTQDPFNPSQYKIDISTIIDNGGLVVSQELLFILYKLNL